MAEPSLPRRLHAAADWVRSLIHEVVGDRREQLEREACLYDEAADRIVDLEHRLALATGWMQAKGCTSRELVMMGLPFAVTPASPPHSDTHEGE